MRSGRQAYWSTKLYFSVREGKQLSKDSSSDANNYYCLLAIDDEVVARTSTVWRSTSNPFFGEEFFIDLRSNFSSIRLYVMSNEKQDPIGKLDFARDVFNENPQVDGWYVPSTMPNASVVSCTVYLQVLVKSDQVFETCCAVCYWIQLVSHMFMVTLLQLSQV